MFFSVDIITVDCTDEHLMLKYIFVTDATQFKVINTNVFNTSTLQIIN